jgi:hypothetical protein
VKGEAAREMAMTARARSVTGGCSGRAARQKSTSRGMVQHARALAEGEKAPDIALKDQNGKKASLSGLRSGPLGPLPFGMPALPRIARSAA